MKGDLAKGIAMILLSALLTCLGQLAWKLSAQEGPLMTRCFSFSGQRDEVLAYLEQADLQGVHIEKVELI